MVSRTLLFCSLIAAIACDPVGSKDDTGTLEPGIDLDGDGYDSSVDCDDDNPDVHPGAPERCDGVDNDCDGFVDDEDPDLEGDVTAYPDADGDGFGDPDAATGVCEISSGYVADDTDCDDADAAVNPEAPELCDGIDNDCDGLLDDEDPDTVGSSSWYADIDGDGYGDPDAAVESCDPPSGTVADSSDCDDAVAMVNPAAAEVCDGVDNDCDGLLDDDDDSLVGAGSWYADNDGDGFGDAADVTVSCEAPAGAVADSSDCDDGAAAVNPDAVEVCDGVDNDCDGAVDDDDSSLVGATTWYADVDSDGYGDAASSSDACFQPSGFVADSTDCDDRDTTTSPGAEEICDGVDNDCDGLVDDDDDSLVGAPIWYADVDVDGYGDLSSRSVACSQPSGYVADATDCDDLDSVANPGASELCDGVDNDCNGDVDEPSAVDASTWYTDADGDGYGDPASTIVACDPPMRHVADSSDCDDTVAALNPGASEVCDGLDNDCDGLVDDADDSLSGARSWYLDADGDGYGDASVSTAACIAPSGYVASATDCDDSDPAVKPLAFEVCDGVDNDCDGLVDDADDDLRGAGTYYLDDDLDGYGDASVSTTTCTVPSGYVASAGDCDDGEPDINPGVSETCNGIDDDCDGSLDSAAACPCNLESYGDHSYLFCEDVSTWWQAYDSCLTVDNFDLATIDDSSEDAWIYAQANSYSSSHWWWLGYHNQSATSSQEPAGAWEWVDGSSSTYTHWDSGQPDDWNNYEDCGHMYGDNGLWNDLGCDLSEWYGSYVYFICESG